MTIKKYLEYIKEQYGSGKNVIILHGSDVDKNGCFYQWLGKELRDRGFEVEIPDLPSPDNPNIEDQVKFLIEKYPSKKDIIICHSMGGITAMKFIEKVDYNIESLYFISCFDNTNFYEGDPDIEKLKGSCDWTFDYYGIKSKVSNIYVLRPNPDTSITPEQSRDLASNFGTQVRTFVAVKNHACGSQEPEILKFILEKEL